MSATRLPGLTSHTLLYLPLPTAILLPFSLNDPSPTEIYTLSLHDALPISWLSCNPWGGRRRLAERCRSDAEPEGPRSEEHTSELQSHVNLVCRLLLEKKKNR